MQKVAVYKVDADINLLLKTIKENETTFSRYKFTPPTGTQKSSLGFVETPLEGFVSEVNGNLLLKTVEQKKSANKNEVEDLLKVKCEKWLSGQVEDTFVPKKVKEGLKDEAEQEILIKTYPQKEKASYILFRKDGLVFSEGNHKQSETILSLVRKVLGSLRITPLETPLPVAGMLDKWLAEEVSDVITLGDKASFVTQDGRKVSLSGDSLFNSEAQDFINKEDMMATSVEFVYDGVITCTLKDTLLFDSIKYSSDLTDEVEDDEAGTLLLKVKEVGNMVDDVLGRLAKEVL